jgi:hypothetical protein
MNDRSKDSSDCDIFSTQNSMILDNDDSLSLLNLSGEIKSKTISRKSMLGSKNNR